MMDPARLRNRLAQVLRERSVRKGDFVLASGRHSSYYVDARVTTMSGEGLALVGMLGLSRLTERGWRPALVGGLTLGADPVAYAIAVAAAMQGQLINAFTVRKEAKSHGTGRRIEGCFTAGARVAVVDDVITTGRSALEAAAAVVAEGGVVVGVLAVVDREEGGRAAIEAAGYDVAALLTAKDLGIEP
jgi:orotate phosphoribosyltransferase